MNIYLTHGNRVIDFANPRASDIHIEDIVHHLSMIPRFNGKLDMHYSVLDHSVYVAMITKTFLKADEKVVFAALMHDAQEAFMCDIPSPLKSLLPEYKKIEAEFELLINERFNIDSNEEVKKIVKKADLLALKAEKEAFFITPPEYEYYWDSIKDLPLIPISPKEFCNDSKDIFYKYLNFYQKL